MMIDDKLLQDWYCKERDKLEAMPCFELEARFKLLKLKEIILDSLDKELNADSLEVKHSNLHVLSLFESHIDKNKTNKILKDNVAYDKEIVAKDFKDNHEKKRAQIPEDRSHEIYAQFLYQLEKIRKIERELRVRGLDPEITYRRYKDSGSVVK